MLRKSKSILKALHRLNLWRSLIQKILSEGKAVFLSLQPVIFHWIVVLALRKVKPKKLLLLISLKPIWRSLVLLVGLLVPLKKHRFLTWIKARKTITVDFWKRRSRKICFWNDKYWSIWYFLLFSILNSLLCVII